MAAVAAGQATRQLLLDEDPYPALERLGAHLEDEMVAAAREAGVPLTMVRAASMFTAFFAEGPITDFTSAKRSDTKRFARYHAEMLARGVYLAPSQFEAGFLSSAHTAADVDRTLSASREALRAI